MLPILVTLEGLQPWLAPVASRFPEIELRFGATLTPDIVVFVGEKLPEPGPHIESLRWVHLLAAGYDSFLGRELPKPGLLLTNSSGGFSDGIADFVLMRMLMHARKAEAILDAQRDRAWRRDHLGGRTLRGKHVVIIGDGSIGREVGRLCLAFGMNVEIAGRVDRERLPEWVAQAHYVVVAASLNPSSRGILSRELITHMRNKPYLVNISRGALLDTAAVIDALESGQLSGAALDVFDKEPLPSDSPLWSLPGVSVSPHISGVFEEVEANIAEVFCRNLDCFLKGEPLPNRISLT